MWPCPSPCATVRLSPWMLLQIAVLPRSGSGWWPAVTNRRAEQIVDCSSRLPRLGPLAVDGGRLSPAASNQALKEASTYIFALYFFLHGIPCGEILAPPLLADRMSPVTAPSTSRHASIGCISSSAPSPADATQIELLFS